MASSQKAREIGRLAREAAGLTGEPSTDAMRKALPERLKRKRLRRAATGLTEQLAALTREFEALPDFDTRSPDEIVGHDKVGLWR